MSSAGEHISEFTNRDLPEVKLSNLGTDPISGVLGRDRAKHLLERCLFGARRSELDQFATLTIGEALDILLADLPAPSPPLNINPEDTGLALGETWIHAPFKGEFNALRKKSLRSWWFGLSLDQGASLVEKMTLFWHNHFVTEIPVVNRPKLLYDHYALLRQYSLGNFRDLSAAITVDAAMLRYLDGEENVAGAANENYSRELFELFTIGKGPLISDGNYTNYTEHDIREAARVLTGWKINYADQLSWFNSAKHDKGSKVFSEIYNQTIDNQEEEEYKSLINMIFSKKETARHIVRKVYRWFVYYIIDESIETAVIEPLATILFDADFEMKPMLGALLGSEHFFDETYRACYIKNPMEHVAGTLRKLEVEHPEDFLVRYEFWNTWYYQVRDQEMTVGQPPDVAGWPQWYLEPQYNQLWVNSVTIPQKAFFTDKICDSGWTSMGEKVVADPVAVAGLTSVPSDPNVLISELAELLFPVQLGTEKMEYLKGILIPGLPDFEWTLEWNRYADNPSDQNQKQAVEAMLRGVLKTMMKMPEYYLI
jgi:hypothetical protein